MYCRWLTNSSPKGNIQVGRPRTVFCPHGSATKKHQRCYHVQKPSQQLRKLSCGAPCQQMAAQLVFQQGPKARHLSRPLPEGTGPFQAPRRFSLKRNSRKRVGVVWTILFRGLCISCHESTLTQCTLSCQLHFSIAVVCQKASLRVRVPLCSYIPKHALSSVS